MNAPRRPRVRIGRNPTTSHPDTSGPGLGLPDIGASRSRFESITHRIMVLPCNPEPIVAGWYVSTTESESTSREVSTGIADFDAMIDGMHLPERLSCVVEDFVSQIAAQYVFCVATLGPGPRPGGGTSGWHQNPSTSFPAESVRS
jgi:hypothetical protein